MSHIAVFVRGGVVQGLVADDNTVQVMIVDYDNERCSGKTHRVFEQPVVDDDLLSKVANGLE